MELHNKTGRLKEENTEYDELLERFRTEIIKHPEKFRTSENLAGAEETHHAARPLKMNPTMDENSNEETDEQTIKQP